MNKARTVFDAVFLMLVAFNLASFLFLPDSVATHFGRGGAPDGWSSKTYHIIMFTLLTAVIYLSFLLGPKLIEIIPAKYVSLPNREYWLGGDRRGEAVRRTAAMLFSFGTATGLVMLAVLILTVEANLSDPVVLDERIALILFLAYLAYTVVWTVRFFRAFRIPGK